MLKYPRMVGGGLGPDTSAGGNNSASSGGGNSSASSGEEYSSVSPPRVFSLSTGDIQLGKYYTIGLKLKKWFPPAETFNGFFVTHNDGACVFYNINGIKIVSENSIETIKPADLPTDKDIITSLSMFFADRYRKLLTLKSNRWIDDTGIKNLQETEFTLKHIKQMPGIMHLYGDIETNIMVILKQSGDIDTELYKSYFFSDKFGGRRRRATRQKKNQRRSTRSKRRGHIRK